MEKGKRFCYILRAPRPRPNQDQCLQAPTCDFTATSAKVLGGGKVNQGRDMRCRLECRSRKEGLWFKSYIMDFPGGSLVKNSPAVQKTACLCRRQRFDLWVGKIPGERNGNPLQYSCLGNSMDRGAWWLQSLGSQELYTT